MVKLTALVPLLLFACSGAKPVQEAAPVVKPSGGIVGLWQRKVPGLITDLNISRDGRAVIISTAPNREVEGGARQYHVSRYDNRGKLVWQKVPEAPVKAQDISDDGGLLVLSTYDDRLTAFDGSGKELWGADGTCRPIILSALKKIVCYHDDDAESQIAFDVFDWKGKKLLSFPVSNDILALKVSEDERNLAIGLTHGQVLLFNQDFRSLWQSRISGEILDLDVSSGPNPRVAVLLSPVRFQERFAQTVALLDASGKPAGSFVSDEYATRIEYSSHGEVLLLHGNGLRGQYLAGFERKKDPAGNYVEKWRRLEANRADSPSPLALTPAQAIISSEPSLMIGIGANGKTIWRTPVPSQDESANLYLESFASGAGLLAIATDDGVLGVYRIPNP